MFKQLVDELRSLSNPGKKLALLLKEQHPVYKNKSANAVTRMRGYVLYSFFLKGLPDNALIFVYEELESSREAYLVAAAALALRKSEKKRSEMAAFLLKALHNIKFLDNYFSFDHYYQEWPLNNRTTAVTEILNTMKWLGGYAKTCLPTLKILAVNADNRLSQRAVIAIKETVRVIENDDVPIEDCCQDLPSLLGLNTDVLSNKRNKVNRFKEILLEDHDGNQVYLHDFTKGRPTLVAFFYTRCDNPLKCSLTITNLAAIQKKLMKEDWGNKVALSAISYDSFYDHPNKIKNYGESRGILFSEQMRMFRAIPNIDVLRDYFELGVNYTGEVVNRHVIELYLLNGDGRIMKRFQRNQMDNAGIINHLKSIVFPRKLIGSRWFFAMKDTSKSIGSVIVPIFIMFLPKCPFCFAAYLSMFGIAGMQLMPYVKFILPLLLVAMAINIYSLYKMGVRRNSFLPLYLCVLGSAMVVTFGYYSPMKFGLIFGLTLLFLSAILNSLPSRLYLKLKMIFTFPPNGYINRQ